MRRLLVSLVIAVLAIAASPAHAGAFEARATTWQTAMLELVNAERAEAGVEPLVLCARLTDASRKYARVMARTGHFDHTGPDGREPWDRGVAEGYRYRVYGENIAAGQQTVGDVMQAWVDSPGHYANLINARFTHLGVGRAPSTQSQYSPYWVQNFGAGGKCGS